jgi:basic membrane protein A
VTHGPGLGAGDDDLADAGGQDAARKLGITWNVIESLDPAAYAPNVAAGAEQGDLTVGVGSRLADAFAQVAPDYPDDAFLLVDAVVDGPNVASVVFRDQEAAFLAGIAAAWATKSNRVGIIGGQQAPAVDRMEYGFRAGILAENADCVVTTAYAETFEDPARGKELALSLFDDGADIVFVVAGETGLGAYEAARERGEGHWIIGTDIDRESAAPGVQLCLTRKGIDTAVYLTAQAVAGGAFAGGTYELGLAEKGVSLETPGDRVEAAIVSRVGTYQSRIVAGEFTIPTSEDEFAAWEIPAPVEVPPPCDCYA